MAKKKRDPNDPWAVPDYVPNPAVKKIAKADLEALPKWTPVPRMRDADAHDMEVRRTVDVGGSRYQHQVPPQEYEWMLNRAGNFVTVPVRCNTLDPYNPENRRRGIDPQANRDMRVNNRVRDGFFCVHNPGPIEKQRAGMGYDNNNLDEYWDYLIDVANYRRNKRWEESQKLRNDSPDVVASKMAGVMTAEAMKGFKEFWASQPKES